MVLQSPQSAYPMFVQYGWDIIASNLLSSTHHDISLEIQNGALVEYWGSTQLYTKLTRGCESVSPPTYNQFWFDSSGYLACSGGNIVAGGMEPSPAVNGSGGYISVLHYADVDGAQVLLSYFNGTSYGGTINITGYTTGWGPSDMIYWKGDYIGAFGTLSGNTYVYKCSSYNGSGYNIYGPISGVSPALSFDDNYIYMSIVDSGTLRVYRSSNGQTWEDVGIEINYITDGRSGITVSDELLGVGYYKAYEGDDPPGPLAKGIYASIYNITSFSVIQEDLPTLYPHSSASHWGDPVLRTLDNSIHIAHWVREEDEDYDTGILCELIEI